MQRRSLHYTSGHPETRSGSQGLCYNAPMKAAFLDNPLLGKALRLLVHPLTILALVLLLVNDHVLRRVWPSALTGKLGDFAWLFFIPLAFAACLALFAPRRGRLNRAIPPFAYISVALIFALAKTLPAAHALVVSAASRLFGFEVGWLRDPTDLVALASLAGSAVLWAKTPKPQPAPVRGRLGIAGWAALAAAVLLTVANSPAPDPGIYCLDERAGELDAYTGYATYRSTDGGLTWESLPNQPRGACPNPWSDDAGATLTTVDPTNRQRQYRMTPGQSIELSEDNGANWRVVYQVPAVSEAAAAATRRRLSSYAMVRPVPLDGKVDRTTGNAVFAMGHVGVLVHEAASGEWREAAVGPYRPVDANAFADFAGLLVGEILLAVGIVLLGFDSLATRLLVRHKALWVFVLALTWVIWAGIVFVVPPAMTYGYGSVLTYGAMLVLGLVLLVLTVIALVGSLQQAQGSVRSNVGRPLGVSVLAGVLFLLPYALWATGTLPSYVLASVLGTILGVGTIAGGAFLGRSGQDLPL